MPPIEKVNVELAVMLGSTRMPIHQLLRLGRGAVIELGANENDPVTLLVNDHPIARGTIVVDGGRIGVEIIEMLMRDEPGRRERAGAGKAAAVV